MDISSATARSPVSRPNFFVAIRLNSLPFHDVVNQIQRDVLARAPKLKRCSVPPNKAHLTCFVLSLTSKAHIEMAVECLSACLVTQQKQHHSSQLSTISSKNNFPCNTNSGKYLTFDRLGRFNSRVLYLAPREDEVLLELRELTKLIAKHFMESGLSSSNDIESNQDTGQNPLSFKQDHSRHFVAENDAAQESSCSHDGNSVNEKNNVPSQTKDSLSAAASLKNNVPSQTKDSLSAAASGVWTPHLTLFKTSADRKNGRKLKILEEHYSGCENLLNSSALEQTAQFPPSQISQDNSDFVIAPPQHNTSDPSLLPSSNKAVSYPEHRSQEEQLVLDVDYVVDPADVYCKTLDGSKESAANASREPSCCSHPCDVHVGASEAGVHVPLTTIDLLSMCEKDVDGYYKSYARFYLQ